VEEVMVLMEVRLTLSPFILLSNKSGTRKNKRKSTQKRKRKKR
jgi:hypothetical protein